MCIFSNTFLLLFLFRALDDPALDDPALDDPGLLHAGWGGVGGVGWGGVGGVGRGRRRGWGRRGEHDPKKLKYFSYILTSTS
jgi:hypothetical protein